ncbi:hypothetical protein H0H92_015000 [Tricholoma furcatifolium]|nr:hypothetical protein H0H92_015000 [Tricholoma furcatifolium]
MTPEERKLIQVARAAVWYNVKSTAASFILYGFSTPLAIQAISEAIKAHSFRRYINLLNLAMMLFGFFASMAIVFPNIVLNFGPIYVLARVNTGTSELTLMAKSLTLSGRANAATNWSRTILPIVNDAFVIWQAWVIFAKSRWALCILGATWLSSLALDLTHAHHKGMSIAGLILNSDGVANIAAATIDPSLSIPVSEDIQNNFIVASTALSFVTNLLCAFFIAFVLWFVRATSVLQLPYEDDSNLKLLYLILVTVPHTPLSAFGQGINAFTEVFVTISAFYPTIVGFLIEEICANTEIQTRAIDLESAGERSQQQTGDSNELMQNIINETTRGALQSDAPGLSSR